MGKVREAEELGNRLRAGGNVEVFRGRPETAPASLASPEKKKGTVRQSLTSRAQR